MAKKKRKVLNTKIYTIKLEEFDDKATTLTRTNDGFDLFQLLGVIGVANDDIIKTLKGTMKEPTRIKRQIVK